VRAKLSLTVGLLGLLALVLTVITAAIYERMTLQNHQLVLGQITQRAVAQLETTLRNELTDLAFAIQSEAEFRRTALGTDRSALYQLLLQEFQRHFATEGLIQLQRIAVYDKDLKLLSIAAEQAQGDAVGAACEGLVQRARLRRGLERVKTQSMLCASAGKAYYSLLVPIGGLTPQGFLQLESDPVVAMTRLEGVLGAPIEVAYSTGEIAYRSATWPQASDASDVVVAQYAMTTDAAEPALSISIANDIRELRARLSATLDALLTVAVIATLIAAATTHQILERAVVRPLERLSQQLQKVRSDKAHLGEKVDVRGDTEVRQLAETFNLMAGELNSLYDTLQNMAFTDPLTQLPNRLHLQESLNELISRYRNDGLSFALFMIDLDRFKQINDTLGHLAGDALLQQVAQRLREALQPAGDAAASYSAAADIPLNSVARLGGDEFASLLPQVATPQKACSAAASVLASMRQPFDVAGHQINVDLSIGIALYPQHGADGPSLLRCADMAMYDAKRHGRGYSLFELIYESRAIRQFDLENDLRKALTRGQLSLHYQPQVDVATWRVQSVEALMRWHHHDEDLVPPDLFIPLAEQANLIRPLTLWAVEHALQDVAAWVQAGHDMRVAVNVAPSCLQDADFAELTLTMLHRRGIRPDTLTLEVTERGHPGQLAAAAPALAALADAGVRISVDDFGAGFPTLAQLKQLPLRQLKIDKSFIFDMLTNPSDAAVIRATVDIARQRNLEIVAEGVENMAQWQALRDFGVGLAQGYMIARPLSYDDLLIWLGTATKNAIWQPAQTEPTPVAS
jgi:diguanylate cyclase (GGDEF)-like protein